MGEKESDFAAAIQASSAAAAQVHSAAVEKGKEKDKSGSTPVSLPKLPVGAMPASSGGKPKVSKAKFPRPDGGSTAATSRSTSVVPDIHIVRPPSKMRNILAAPPSEGADNVEEIL